MQWAYSVSLLVFSVYVYHKFSEMKYNTVPIQGLGVMEEIENRKTTKTKLYEEHRLPCLPIDDHKDGIVCVSVRGSAFQMNLYILSNPCNVKWAKRATKKRTSKYQSQQKKWIWITVSHSRIYRHTLSHSWNDWNRVNSYGANSRTKTNYNGNARLKVGLCCLPAFPNTYTVHKHNLRRSHWSSVIRFLPLFFGHVCPFVLRLWR